MRDEKQWYQQWYPMVRGIANGVNGGYTTPVEDLVQEGFIGLLEAERSYDARGPPFRSYARHRVRGAMMDALRRAGPFSREQNRRVQELGESAVHAASRLAVEYYSQKDHQDMTARLVGSELEARLHEALGLLKQDDRAVVAAVYDVQETGDSGAELARRIGQNRSAVSRRHMTVLGRLRRLIGGDEDGRDVCCK